MQAVQNGFLAEPTYRQEGSQELELGDAELMDPDTHGTRELARTAPLHGSCALSMTSNPRHQVAVAGQMQLVQHSSIGEPTSTIYQYTLRPTRRLTDAGKSRTGRCPWGTTEGKGSGAAGQGLYLQVYGCVQV